MLVELVCRLSIDALHINLIINRQSYTLTKKRFADAFVNQL